MRVEVSQHDIGLNQVMKTPESASCESLRLLLRRPDLDDATLREAVAGAVENSPRLSALGDSGSLVERVLSGEVPDEVRRAVVASLCLPAPRAPLAMPLQVLEREDARAPFLARLFGRSRARQG